MLNKLHQFYFTLINKIRRNKRKKNLITVPKQKKNYVQSSRPLMFDPIIYPPSFIYEEAKNNKYNYEILNFLNQQISEPYIEFIKKYYEEISKSHKEFSNYIDLIKILFVISKIIEPENYLEVGVRRGRSMSIVANNSPNCNMYGFDMWLENYSGVENPGSVIVKEELKKASHTGNVEFFNGDSKITIPNFKKKFPNIYFDMICIDGDHSYNGAKKDLLNVIDLLKIGGYLIFDDTNSFEHPFLSEVWKKIVKSRDNFITQEFNEHGLGVSIAVRIF